MGYRCEDPEHGRTCTAGCAGGCALGDVVWLLDFFRFIQPTQKMTAKIVENVVWKA